MKFQIGLIFKGKEKVTGKMIIVLNKSHGSNALQLKYVLRFLEQIVDSDNILCEKNIMCTKNNLNDLFLFPCLFCLFYYFHQLFNQSVKVVSIR